MRALGVAFLVTLALISMAVGAISLYLDYAAPGALEPADGALVSADPLFHVPVLPRGPRLSGILPSLTGRGDDPPLARLANEGVVPTAEPAVRQPTRPSSPGAVPIRVRIPKIDIDAPVVALGLTGSRTVGTPADGETVAWYTQTSKPGQDGVAMLSGHRDWAGAPGSFYRLRDLRPGDLVEIGTTEGGTMGFVVWQTEVYPTAGAPSGEIMRQDGPPALVLVTCEGTFNYATQDYSHRRVVLAVDSSVPTRVSR